MRKRDCLLLLCLLALPSLSWGESLFGGLTQDYAAMTNCQNGKEIEEEFSKLFKVIKSDILGGKPKFCEAYKEHSLNKQINESNNEFDQFMAMLNKIPGSKESHKNILSLEGMDHKDIFFEVVKMVAIRKHWAYVDEDKRDGLLLNNACASSQINKIPLPEKKYQAQFKMEGFTSDQIVESLCLARTMDQILFGIDKDIIAEAFLNLKQMFPRDYSKFTDYFCLEVMNLPEALVLNYNSNDIKNTKDLIASSEQFSKWLNESFRTIANKEERAKKLESINASAMKKAQTDQLKLISMGMQDKYKIVYDNKKPNEKAIIPESSDYEVIKNSQNIYIAKKISNKSSDEFNAKMEKNSKAIFESYIEKIKKGEMQIPNVTFSNFHKDKKIEFKVDKDKHAALVTAIDEAFEGFSESKNQKKKIDDSEAGQIALEYMYNQYLHPADKDDLLFPGDTNPVFINAQGKYEKREDDFTSGKYLKKAYEQQLEHIKPVKIGKYEVLPDQFGSFFVKKANGTYMQAYFSDKNKGAGSGEAYEEEEENEEMAQLKNPKAVNDLQNALNVNYQKADKTIIKMTQLSSEELAAIKSYTGSEYNLINGCLRKENCADVVTEKAKNLKNALSKLSEKEKPLVLYRGVGDLPDEILKNLNENKKVVLDKGFMSTSGNLKVASGFAGYSKTPEGEEISGGIILMFKARSCVGISALSYFETEDEFLCPPGLTFKAKKIEGKNQYILEEVEK